MAVIVSGLQGYIINSNRVCIIRKLFGSVFSLICLYVYICLYAFNMWVLLLKRYVAKLVKQTTKTKIPNTQDKNLWIRPWCFPVKLLLHLSSAIQESWQVYSPGKIADSFTSEEAW